MLLPGEGRFLRLHVRLQVCPGRHFALRTLFLNISYTLSVFDISAPTSEKLEAKFEESTIRYVLISDPYLATLVPASN